MAPDSQARRLLTLDDDADVNVTVCLIAQQIGFEARSTTEPAEFFRLLACWSPSHIIVDLVMPNIDGIEIIKRLPDYNTPAALIITSGLGSRVVEAAARAATESGLEVAGLLPKPFTPADLRQLLAAPSSVRISHSQNVPVADDSEEQFAITEQVLAQALRERQFTVFYQPKLCCTTGHLVGLECLARWQHPTQGMLFPDRFIPLAEGSGLIAQLTEQIFVQALEWFAAHCHGQNLQIALNLSAKTLSSPEFPDWVAQQCTRLGVAPQQVVLEVTETSSMENPVATLQILTQFRIKGFSLSIDDFGIGYSSLIQLARLPFSELKIDKMFVISAPYSEESQKIVSAVISLGRALNLSVTAEGVEDAWTLQYLKDAGCDYAQGFLFSRPVDGEAFLAWKHSREPTV
ncbi:GGDEF/EAL domain-containing response regulator [Kineobactrum salinum]|uniref:EAL domain-containing response regulator n=1 Tax=Kineobactrum salinum TaxID=2708301 RepID=A0A6C0U542_9GAMM|nr:EAL domain-containing response regulator [Kineobactrum salinum]QIB67048.1 EAL domain-containing response regulator [Kineobactrum salinum]